MKYPLPCRLAAAAAKDALFLTGELVGAFLVGVEEAACRLGR